MTMDASVDRPDALFRILVVHADAHDGVFVEQRLRQRLAGEDMPVDVVAGDRDGAASADLILALSVDDLAHVIDHHPDATNRAFTFHGFAEALLVPSNANISPGWMVSDVKPFREPGTPPTSAQLRYLVATAHRNRNAASEDAVGTGQAEAGAELVEAVDTIVTRLTR